VLVQRAVSEGPRWTRAVEDQSAPIPEEITSELGGIICSLVRRPPVDPDGYPSKRGKESELGIIDLIVQRLNVRDKVCLVPLIVAASLGGLFERLGSQKESVGLQFGKGSDE
jgi:hypothetical protein